MKKAVLIYADFMKADNYGRLVLTCLGTHKDLTENNIVLEEGMELVFYTDDADDNGNRDDLVVQGIVEYDDENNNWAAKINWNEVKNISQLTKAKRNIFNLCN